MTDTTPWHGDIQMIAWDHGPMEFVRTGFGGVCYFRSRDSHISKHWYAVCPGPLPIREPPRGAAR